MKRKIALILMMTIAGTLLCGCNTARGVGEDIQGLGHIISRAAS
ncbi:entericidin A/B family lipoprotein [Leclercia pneumoniae]|nr:entericidin EcnA/B family protein [Enterobacteriaceae bacterium ATCC 29904]